MTTCMVSDSLDAAGARGQVMGRGISSPVTGARVMGRAATVWFVATDVDSQDPYAEAINFIDSLGAGSVPVIATGEDARTACWGELFSAAARGRGAVGTICDGPIRDMLQIRALGYPVFAAGTRPVDFRARMRIAQSATTIRCAGVTVAQGDLVLADDDEVVVVPANVERQVLALAVARARAEGTVLAELLGGAKLRDVWQRWGVL